MFKSAIADFWARQTLAFKRNFFLILTLRYHCYSKYFICQENYRLLGSRLLVNSTH